MTHIWELSFESLKNSWNLSFILSPLLLIRFKKFNPFLLSSSLEKVFSTISKSSFPGVITSISENPALSKSFLNPSTDKKLRWNGGAIALDDFPKIWISSPSTVNLK